MCVCVNERTNERTTDASTLKKFQGASLGNITARKKERGWSTLKGSKIGGHNRLINSMIHKCPDMEYEQKIQKKKKKSD